MLALQERAKTPKLVPFDSQVTPRVTLAWTVPVSRQDSEIFEEEARRHPELDSRGLGQAERALSPKVDVWTEE